MAVKRSSHRWENVVLVLMVVLVLVIVAGF